MFWYFIFLESDSCSRTEGKISGYKRLNIDAFYWSVLDLKRQGGKPAAWAV